MRRITSSATIRRLSLIIAQLERHFGCAVRQIGLAKQLHFCLLSISLKTTDTTGGRIVSNRILSTIHIAILSACALSAGIGSAASQSPPAPAPKFAPAAGAIVGGMSGLVAATASGLNDYRSTQRLMLFRTALTESLTPGLDVSKPITIALTNEQVLCSMRPKYAAAAAKAAYINAVTSTLNQFATPPTITTIGQAFISVFQNYEIDPKTGQMKVADDAAVARACKTDLNNWPLSFYGAPLAGPPKPGIGPLEIGAALGTFGDLLTQLNEIITPVATQTAQFIDATRRQQAITQFLTNPQFQKDLLAAANALADNGNRLITTNRLQAIGQFEEKLAIVRTFNIDLSKIEACKTAMAAPALADENGVPTDAFVMCYAQTWAQLKDVVQAVISAASQYDALADASSDQLGNSVMAIQAHIDALKNPQLSIANAAQLLDAATQLITIGQSVQKALSPDNVAKLEKDAQNVMNLFK